MKSLLKLLPYVRPYTWLIVVSIILAFPLSALRLAPAPLVKFMMDDLLKNGNAHRIVLFPALVIGIYVLNFVVRFFHYYLLRVVIARVNQKIKTDLFDHVMGLSADYFTQESTGTLISRVASDPQQVDAGISCINILVREPITFLFLFAYAVHLDWKLTLIALGVFPLLAWLFSITGRNLKRYISKMQEENARIFSTLQESFTGIRVIKTFQLGKYVNGKFDSRVGEFTRFLLKTAVLEETAHPMVELITAFAVAGVVYYGCLQVVHHQMTSGELLAFFTAFAIMMNPIRMLNDVNMKLHQASAATDRIFQVFAWKSNLFQPANPLPIQAFKTDLALENVTFAYPDTPERKVLTRVSFRVPKGQTVALVGASGAGKSSLVSLIPRIFDVTSGKITVDGTDIRELAIEEWRRLVAVVSQDVFLFNDTIEENIRCGRLDATRKEIEDAARRAHVLDFVSRLPEGLNTIIGDRGQKLSGGERQRLSIARAFLRGAPILILDEATSSLDSASEKIVQEAINDLMENRTTLIIAHRLSTIRHVDRIIVIREGEIVESGNHDELLGLNGEYARFHSLSQIR